MGTLRYEYEFDLGENGVVTQVVEIDEETLVAEPEAREGVPGWADLECNQCDNCPLAREDTPHCPLAASISGVVDAFVDRISCENAAVQVTVPERTYTKKVPLQSGLASLLGLIMATSACPHMHFLRPMARFHLPFSSAQETIVRTLSFFLLRRYFENQQDGAADYELGDLNAAYEALQDVNRGIVGRMRSAMRADADPNAIVVLDTLAMLLSQGLASNLSEVEELFA